MRITWTPNEGIGQSGWTGTVNGRRLFTITYSVKKGVGFELRTSLPFGLVKDRATGDADTIKEYAERVLVVFTESLGASFPAPASPVIGYNINEDKLAQRIGCDLAAVRDAAQRMAEAVGLDNVVAGESVAGMRIIHQAVANSIYAELAQ